MTTTPRMHRTREWAWLSALAADMFAALAVQLHFVREAAGDITGFQLIGFMLPGNKQNKEHMTAASQ